MPIIKITDLNLSNKRVLIRSDLNVPIQNKKIISYARINASLPTIKLALKNNAKVIVASHLGRPKEGFYDSELSLFPIFKYFQEIFKKYKVYFCKNYLNGIETKSGELTILENVRFNKGEKNNNKHLSKTYANLCDIFVMDAFGSLHRNESSTYGLSKYSKIACSGLLLESELTALKKIIKKPIRPMITIVGGAKVSTKFNLLKSLAKISDTLIVGGGIANTFIAIDNNVGKSLYEPNFIHQAKLLRDNYNIFIPIDSKVSTTFNENSIGITKKVSDIDMNEEIMDFGENTITKMLPILQQAKTILWNGPIGVFEFKNFRKGTTALAQTIANSNAFSVAGGGDTLSVIEILNITSKISYISTGGGSFLKFLEQEEFPIIKLLERFI
ncbi:phosphoglycerate kinase [Buchnera aphidicola]|uniref:Phosphoglycerate kinase n=1 Tax=Buchnera aphidicola subsp. Melaphis rhois TaxID=118103 RepID=A0A4D6Y4A6_BUCMH|nr:phosphoglycerate kinase [Buchnera aphidicola]QCI23413.1 phosphoglycerate kinase [Buchnera aphidicola (Melaphis rhois)]